MSKEREALKLALNAMNAMLTHMGMDEHEFNKVTYDQMRQAIAVVKKALAQPEQKPVAWPCRIDIADFSENTIMLVMQCEDYKVSAGTHWLSTTPPQRTEQEPVAWMFQHEETGRTMCVDSQQVEWGFEKSNPRLKKIAPLYTTPPQRTWVGLTDEDELDWEEGGSLKDLVKAIEAKLREKNESREWQDLTDDEMLMIYGQKHEGKKYNLGRMVQQALKEKNNV